MSGPIVGIDLGTSNSVVTVVDEAGANRVLADTKGYKIQPSVVSFHPNGSVLVGAEAKQRRMIDPSNTVYSAKRLIGRTYQSPEVSAASERMPYRIKEGVNQQPVIGTRAGEFAIPEVSAIILDHMRSIARTALDTEIDRAVITVPANFTDAQRSATATAGAIAGITVVRVLNEPTAAALAYGQLHRGGDQVIAVYDFGGGTFDVTLLALRDDVYEVLSTAGDSFLGGDDIDERLVDHMVQLFLAQTRTDLRPDELAMQRLRAVAEQTKIELSRRARAIIRVDEIAYGAGGKALDLQLEITRDEFIDRIADIVGRTFPVCIEALAAAGIRSEQIDDIVLVGGTTKMPFVREQVLNFFGKAPRTDINPDEAVAVGAGIQADALARVLGGAPARPTARRAVAPPAPPMEAQPPGTATRARSRSEFTDEQAAARRTAPRVATSSEQRANAPAEQDLIGGDFEGDTTEILREQQVLPEAGRSTQPAQVPPIPRGGRSGAPLARITRPGTVPPRIPGPSAARERIRPGAVLERDSHQRPAAADESVGLDTVDSGFGVDTHDIATDIREPPRLPEPPRPPPPLPRPQASTAIGTAVPIPVAPMPRAPAPSAPVPPVAPARPPVVLDVIPQALSIGTVAGYCDEIIHRNAHVPCHDTRMFATSQDFQEAVRIRICQGNSRRLDENLQLGEVVLQGLEPRKRGEVTIEVAFQINADGILEVSAKNQATGARRTASVNLLGAQSPEEIRAAQERFKALQRS